MRRLAALGCICNRSLGTARHCACRAPVAAVQEVKQQVAVLKRAQEQAFVEQQRQALEVRKLPCIHAAGTCLCSVKRTLLFEWQ